MLSILPPTLFATFSTAVRRPEPPSLSRPFVPSAVYEAAIMNLGMFDSPFAHAVRPSRGFVSGRPLGDEGCGPPQGPRRPCPAAEAGGMIQPCRSLLPRGRDRLACALVRQRIGASCRTHSPRMPPD